MIDVFVVAFGLGLVLNAAPGAVFTESLRRGVRGGFRPAFGVQVGSLVGDATWAVLGLAGLGALFTVPALRVPVTVAGCLLLAWLGFTGVRDGLRGGAGPDLSTAPGGRGALGTDVGMSLSNPPAPSRCYAACCRRSPCGSWTWPAASRCSPSPHWSCSGW